MNTDKTSANEDFFEDHRMDNDGNLQQRSESVTDEAQAKTRELLTSDEQRVGAQEKIIETDSGSVSNDEGIRLLRVAPAVGDSAEETEDEKPLNIRELKEKGCLITFRSYKEDASKKTLKSDKPESGDGPEVGADRSGVLQTDPHADQWYNKNPLLARLEIAAMRRHYPRSGYSFFKTNGNMYWIVTMDISNTSGITKSWTFMLIYDKDHPKTRGDDYSVKVIPVKPSLDELEEIAKAHGYPGVPNVTCNYRHFLKRYLRVKPIVAYEYDENMIRSAAAIAIEAADWASSFEAGIQNKEAWNKWCGNSHFRHMQVK